MDKIHTKLRRRTDGQTDENYSSKYCALHIASRAKIFIFERLRQKNPRLLRSAITFYFWSKMMNIINKVYLLGNKAA